MADHDGLSPLPPLFDAAAGRRPPQVDADAPHIARVYDYLLGGKDHFRADRKAAELIQRANPYIRDACRQQREFLRRAIRHLSAAGLHQFVDIGTGLPTVPTAHQIARAVDPGARVAYVDNDPVVLSHVQVLLSDGTAGTAFVEGDFRTPEALLADPGLRTLIDLEEPVAILVTGLLHFLPDHEAPARHLKTLMDACPPGSHLVLTHGTADLAGDLARGTAAAYRQSAIPCRLRDGQEVLELLGELEPIAPGLVPMAEWRPDAAVTRTVRERQIAYGVVGRKGGGRPVGGRQAAGRTKG
ncbi:SAM-dependent methyltransferase [Catenulispora yoronensis]|uniref:SAM-dependent methyltransferase n=1 Tax=Catenulispora yoronensis TaxID=450799 RepID=A0ABN2VQC4_9ACTN